VIFVPDSIYVLYYVDLFAYVGPSLCPWNETTLIIVYDLLNVLLNSVCKYFIENFYIYVHQGNWFIVFVVVMSLSSFSIRLKLAL
jgi:hypothetical protein